MAKLLGRAFKEASKLPEIEQNALAKWVIEELKSEDQRGSSRAQEKK